MTSATLSQLVKTERHIASSSFHNGSVFKAENARNGMPSFSRDRHCPLDCRMHRDRPLRVNKSRGAKERCGRSMNTHLHIIWRTVWWVIPASDTFIQASGIHIKRGCKWNRNRMHCLQNQTFSVQTWWWRRNLTDRECGWHTFTGKLSWGPPCRRNLVVWELDMGLDSHKLSFDAP